MAEFAIVFDMDNAAFKPRPEPEVVRILRRVIDHIEIGCLTSGAITDINGNRVGEWAILRSEEGRSRGSALGAQVPEYIDRQITALNEQLMACMPYQPWDHPKNKSLLESAIVVGEKLARCGRESLESYEEGDRENAHHRGSDQEV